ncbi:DUF6114 domain-containing protein [Streptomyces sp. NPDC005485]|uniref:DUF6114 domain-containing protein n=1 Tax=Streptomyces sp. NPDC005485 TaxID=3155591 RepID=UPI0033A6F4AC
MSAESSRQDEHYLTVFRRVFRVWRGQRPFWAGLFVMLGGFPIAYFPYAHLQIGHLTLAMATTAGAGSLIIGVLLVVLGLSLWFQKHVRTFAGVAAILLALVSIPVANLGGFLIGFLFALIGGAMAVSWMPGEPEAEPAATATRDADDTPGGSPADTPGGPDGLTKSDEYGHDHGHGPIESGRPGEARGLDGPNGLHHLSAPHDLSGTIPANGANGRHSAG